jgi:hypothetical protein
MSAVTTGQMWRRKRNLAMASVAIQGGSTRFLADVFDLDAARVCRILRALRVEFPGLDERAIGEAILGLKKSCSDRRQLARAFDGVELASIRKPRKSAPTLDG